MSRKKYLVVVSFLLLIGCFYFVFRNFINFHELNSKNIDNKKQPIGGVALRASGGESDSVLANKSSSKIVKSSYSANNYLNAKNLDSYIDDLKKSDEKNVSIAKAKAFEECRILAIRPNFVSELPEVAGSTNQKNTILLKKYGSEFTNRCADLVQHEPISRKIVEESYNKAASDGSLEAMAYQLKKEVSDVYGNPSPDASRIDGLHEKLIDLVSVGDPSTIFSLSELFGDNSKFSGPATGSNIAVAAWQLAACDMGLDCSESSTLLRNFCFGGMYCEAGDLRTNMRNVAFSPFDFEKVLQLEKEIYGDIKNGAVKKLF